MTPSVVQKYVDQPFAGYTVSIAINSMIVLRDSSSPLPARCGAVCAFKRRTFM
jgi:hypothetical protein